MPREIAEIFWGDPCRKCSGTARYKKDARCVSCRKAWSKGNKRKQYLKEYRNLPEHKVKRRSTYKKWYQSHRGRSVMLWHYAKARAKSLFTITPSDIERELIIGEEKWKKMGIEFDYSGTNEHRAYSPSVDQIKAGEGYTPNNIQIVPWAWNALKGQSLTDDEAFDFCVKVSQSKK